MADTVPLAVAEAARLLVKNREHIAQVNGEPLLLDVKDLRAALQEFEP